MLKRELIKTFSYLPSYFYLISINLYNGINWWFIVNGIWSTYPCIRGRFSNNWRWGLIVVLNYSFKGLFTLKFAVEGFYANEIVENYHCQNDYKILFIWWIKYNYTLVTCWCYPIPSSAINLNENKNLSSAH